MRGTKAKRLRREAGVAGHTVYDPMRIHAKAFKGAEFNEHGMPMKEVHPVINPIRLAEGSARQMYQRSKR